jgi:hypothetical protein
MKDPKQISSLLEYLYKERNQVESTGDHLDSDLTKVYDFINNEIQELQMKLFKTNYQEYAMTLKDQIELNHS